MALISRIMGALQARSTRRGRKRRGGGRAQKGVSGRISSMLRRLMRG